MFATRPTLVFTTGRDWFQALVTLGTFSEIGHAAIGLGDHLLHVHEGGVTFEPRENWFIGHKQKLVGEYEIVPDVSSGVQHCFIRIGERYDVLGVFRAALWIALRRLCSTIPTVGPPSKHAHTCTSFVMLLDPDGELIPEWRNINRAVVTPLELFQAAQGPSFRLIDTWAHVV